MYNDGNENNLIMTTRIPNYQTINDKHTKAMREEFESRTLKYLRELQGKIKKNFPKKT
ncbi:MAG: hypothetical protein JWM20_802 [Patescibacteria group bacterium]|nr:hypothetical protein [Patescibacteria group bacterium]